MNFKRCCNFINFISTADNEYCCENGANNPDCCENGGSGEYCCENGANNPGCCPDEPPSNSAGYTYLPPVS